jgi:Fe-S cluster assembly iron-binding protein IscA
MNLFGIINGLLIRQESDKTKQLSLEVDSGAATNTRTTLKAAQTADRELTLPDNDSELADVDSVQTLENKTMDFSTSGNNNLTADAIDIIFDNTDSLNAIKHFLWFS